MPNTHETSDINQPAQLNVEPKTLAAITVGGLIVGALIVTCAIMPAEFNTDPLGVGKLTRISSLWAPEEKKWTAKAGVEPAHSSPTPISVNTFDIPLGASDWPEASLEYKVAMQPGQTILYSWSATNEDGTPVTVPVEFDFHGHTLEADKEMTVAEYRKDRALSDTGSLTAPFAGIHGWFFKNHAPDPITVHLEVRGFYTLVPPGKPGNDFKLKPLEETAPPATPE